MRRGWGVLLLVAGLGAAPALAAGSLSSTTSYADHPVRGTSAAEIYRFMNAHPIADPDGGPSLANITHDHRLRFSTDPAGGMCRVSQLSFVWRFVITLPKAMDETKLAARDRADWQAFVGSLKTHEEHHRAIFLDCGRTFVPAAAELTAPTCSALDAHVRSFVDGQYAACMSRQEAFDRADTPRQLSLPFVVRAKAERGGR